VEMMSEEASLKGVLRLGWGCCAGARGVFVCV
jgi:hypothetical protein